MKWVNRVSNTYRTVKSKSHWILLKFIFDFAYSNISNVLTFGKPSFTNKFCLKTTQLFENNCSNFQCLKLMIMRPHCNQYGKHFPSTSTFFLRKNVFKIYLDFLTHNYVFQCKIFSWKNLKFLTSNSSTKEKI